MNALLHMLQEEPAPSDRISLTRLSDADRAATRRSQVSIAYSEPERLPEQAAILEAYFEGERIPGTALPDRPHAIATTLTADVRTSRDVRFGNLSMSLATEPRFRRLIDSLAMRDPVGTSARLQALRAGPTPTRVVVHDRRIAATLAVPPLRPFRRFFSVRQCIVVDDRVAGRSFDDVVVPADVALGHEMDHASMDPFVRTVLCGIRHRGDERPASGRISAPDEPKLRRLSNAEELRVMGGWEARLLGRRAGRRFHAAHAYPSDTRDGAPAFAVRRDGVAAPPLKPGDAISGRMIRTTPRRVTLRTAAGERVSFSMAELFFASSGIVGAAGIFAAPAAPLLDVARDYATRLARWTLGAVRGDRLTVRVATDGRLELRRDVRTTGPRAADRKARRA